MPQNPAAETSQTASTNSEASQAIPSPLLRLPAELRLAIYHHVFYDDTLIELKKGCNWDSELVSGGLEEDKNCYTISTPARIPLEVLRVCKQIHVEATPVFHKLVLKERIFHFHCILELDWAHLHLPFQEIQNVEVELSFACSVPLWLLFKLPKPLSTLWLTYSTGSGALSLINGPVSKREILKLLRGAKSRGLQVKCRKEIWQPLAQDAPDLFNAEFLKKNIDPKVEVEELDFAALEICD
ncbi:hypothetical protein NA57DRAFT_59976 [Rhizodiscina lignyota]|uniref:F-box domain-containing protein n=1 Tax=Rhizodiscina lignyota TaxID=1504668 RepID=A0A9P4I5A0_9PEZI|nr:hypothetical protein NA57DRAFT_59976 [Rhizodiscina lignyota]